MREVTGVFGSLAAASEAVRRLQALGISGDSITIQVSGATDAPPIRSERHSERIGRQAGMFLADVGKTAAAFVPFVGNDLAEGAVGRTVRDASESAGATAGRLVDAVAQGGLYTPPPSVDGEDGRISVTVRAEPAREEAIRDILVRAGSIRIAVEG